MSVVIEKNGPGTEASAHPYLEHCSLCMVTVIRLLNLQLLSLQIFTDVVYTPPSILVQASELR